MNFDDFCVWMFRLWGLDLGMLEGLERTVDRVASAGKTGGQSKPVFRVLPVPAVSALWAS